MKITENGFYELSKLKTQKLTIEDNLVVIIFDDLNKDIDIDIWENSRVEFYWVLENTDDYKINFIQNKKSSILMIRCLLLSKDYNKLNVRIYSELASNFVKSNIKIVSIVWNNWFVDIDWIIQINNGLEKVEGILKEENLFLWNSWKVRGKPTLLVRSSDVNASHSCKMERISDEKLFYLRSRWIKRKNALSIMIEAKIENLFSCLNMIDSNFYEKLVENILLRIK